jgi:dTDP-4-amino-4,6-dideoxy-D-galactose acyltransferase
MAKGHNLETIWSIVEYFQILDLDSEIFGFPIAKIIPDKLSQGRLEQVISCLKKENVQLAYWASNPNDEESQRAARLHHGFLADRKVTFVVDIGQMPERSASLDWDIKEYADNLPSSEMEKLAIQIGKYSRFGIDPRIPEDKLIDMYKRWIRNSVNRQIADAVFVAHQSGKVVGMVTVGKKNERGDIGLMAVDPGVRGGNLGVALVSAAQDWARRKGFRFAQVVTQGENIAACKLYEKCGYHIDKTEFFYHFWI